MVNNVCGVCDGLKALERKMKTTTHYSNKYALTTVKRSFPDQESPLELTVPHQRVTQDFHCGFCTKSTAGNVGAQHTHVHIDTHTHTKETSAFLHDRVHDGDRRGNTGDATVD